MGYRAPREDCFIVRHPDSMLEAQADFMEIPVEKERYFENGDEVIKDDDGKEANECIREALYWI